MYLINRSGKIKTVILYGSYSAVALHPGKRFPIKGTRDEIIYYRALFQRGIFIDEDKKEVTEVTEVESKMPVSEGEGITSFPIPDSEEQALETSKTIVEDCEDLSPEAVYSYEFLTKKKCVSILKERNIPFSESDTAHNLKNLVISTNPQK